MLSYLKKSKTDLSERGAAIVEGAAVLPFLVMMILATYDLGGALNEYLTLTRIVYEGARYAATLPGLETNQMNKVTNNLPSDTPFTITSAKNETAGTANQSKVYQRINDLLTKSSFAASDFTMIQSGNDNNTWVSITLAKPYKSYFGFFNHMQIQVSASGPYLSQRPS